MSATSNSTAGAAAATAGEGQADGWTPAMENDALSGYLLIICGALSVILILWRSTTSLVRYVRHVSSLTNDTQKYFAQQSGKMSWFKKNIMYSPMLSKRRNREFQLSSAINMGTLPTRLQFVFLFAYLATNVAFCVIDISFSGNFSSAMSQLRNRSGTLAVVNMV